MKIINQIVDWKRDKFLERFIGKELLKTTCEEQWIKTLNGRKIYSHIHSPIIHGKFPGIILVPGGASPGTDYDKGTHLRAKDIASLGFTVLHYDPSGRGKTGGKEDYWGTCQQQELAWVVDYFSKLEYVPTDDIGILSFSIGIVIATGALSRFPMPPIRYLFDWEGPSSKFNITKNDTHKPLKNFPTSNEEFWKDREASKYIGNIECGYFRYQAEIDHVQGPYKGHAIELLNNATAGKALWTKCNDNPMNTLLDQEKESEYHWIPKGLNHRGQISKYLLDLQKQ
jgi:hypothetical protein